MGVSSEPKEPSQEAQTAQAMGKVRAAPWQALPDTGSMGRSWWKQSPQLPSVTQSGDLSSSSV